mmetsp:Transcript_21782/g.24319  ORF Transcript_21782/g.24319 Transcript_21782/m.24319 type:complete len:297 (-) Transcript_21782:234-1124(-)
MSASNTSTLFRGFARPKSPQSRLENPLLTGQFSSYSGGEIPSILSRSPLMVKNSNNNIQTSIVKNRKENQLLSTPGPPPKASLSLMGGLTLPMESRTAQEVQSTGDLPKTPTAGVSTPVPVKSPPYLGGKKSTTSSSSSFESHWVVAHGYSSSIEYKELLAILSSFGRIQREEANGNWLAVQFESRLSAEKAICCQPVLLANSLCGIARGTPSLLQKLNTGKQQQQQQQQQQQPPQKKAHIISVIKSEIPKLDESDILLLENSSDTENRQLYQSKSICDKMLAWYFGWDEEQPHLD